MKRRELEAENALLRRTASNLMDERDKMRAIQEATHKSTVALLTELQYELTSLQASIYTLMNMHGVSAVSPKTLDRNLTASHNERG